MQTFRDERHNVAAGGGRGEREEQLVSSAEQWSENPCDVTAEPRDLVYSGNRTGPDTEP